MSVSDVDVSPIVSFVWKDRRNCNGSIRTETREQGDARRQLDRQHPQVLEDEKPANITKSVPPDSQSSCLPRRADCKGPTDTRGINVVSERV